ncbi:MAG TPA: 2-phospho-L-lactate guanylyltransferase [Myxococcota bacterium]|nr:2-phospho-L-lactate guanylyltransferase [Myxococcota bacterium]
MIAALIPVKRLDAAKSRLWPQLPRASVERLTVAMLEDVLAALLAVRRLGTVVVVTEDEGAGSAARAAGARAFVRPDPGLNAALDAAAAELAGEGAHAVLIVLGDVAGVTSGDISELLGALDAFGGRGVVLAPSRDGGTSALLRAPHDAIPSCFGPSSAAAHRERALRAGIPYRELALPSLAVDLDRAEDVEALLRGPQGAARTRRALHELGWAGAC